MNIVVDGKNVEVDDSYAKLSPEEQAKTQTEIRESISAHKEAAVKIQERQQQNANPSSMDLSNGNSTIRQYADPALAAAGIGVPVAAGLYVKNKLLGMGKDLISRGAGAIAPEAKTATKVADMASSNAIKDIALQGLQRGVQGVTAAAGAIAPYIRGLGGAALALHSEGLNNGEDEMVRRMHQQQDQQMASGQIAPPQGPVAPGQ